MTGTIINVTDGDFDERVLASKVPVLVDFWAPWCGPCKVLNPRLEALASEFPSDKALIAKVDADECPEIVKRYGVRALPTLLIFKGGEMKQNLSGIASKDALAKVLEGFVGNEDYFEHAARNLDDFQIRFQFFAKAPIETIRKAVEANPGYAAEADEHDRKPINYAAWVKRADLGRLLEEFGAVSTAAGLARQGRVDDLAALIEADPAKRDAEVTPFRTPMLEAIAVGQLDVIRYLAGAGAEITVLSPDGAENITANTLIYAIAMDAVPVETLDVLLELGFDAKAANDGGAKVFFDSVRSGKLGLVQRMMDLGFDLDATDEEGKTALEIARKIDQHIRDNNPPGAGDYGPVVAFLESKTAA